MMTLLKQTSIKYIFFLACFSFLHTISFSQWQQNEFVIGTFADPRISADKNFAKDSSSFMKAKNAYFNLLTGPQYYMGARDFSMMDRTLKLAERFNMHLLVIDSRLQVANPAFNADTAMKIISHFKSLNSSAFEGYYLFGEVPQKNVEQVKKWTAFFKKNDPDKLVYSYLLPRYAFSSKNEYEGYVNNLFSDNTSASNVIAYDYYPFNKNGEILNSYFYNLNLISKKAGSKPFWSYILSTSTPNYADPTAYQLNFSVFCPIAYGAKGIVYFTYETIPARYGVKYGDAIIDANGNPTKKYATVKTINRYVAKILGPVIMNSTRVGTFHTSQNSDNEQLSRADVLNPSTLKINNSDLLVGVFKSKTSAAKYFLIVNKKNDTLNNVAFSINGNLTNKLKLYPRMNEFDGTSVSPKVVNVQFVSGNSNFSIDNFLPGEAILFQFQ